MLRCFRTCRVTTALIFLSALSAAGQAISGDQLAYSGSDVILPRLIHKESPSYTREAMKAGLQGDIELVATIGIDGIAHDFLLLSPLGYGLNEEALDCVSRWRFAPALKNGTPIAFRATIEISFRIDGRPFNDQIDRWRADSSALATLLSRKENGKLSDDSLNLLRAWAEKNRRAGQYQMALWQLRGDVVPKDAVAGLERLQKSAKSGFPPAIVALGDMLLDGQNLPQDSRRGLALLKKASTLGYLNAERDLGKRYMAGNGVARNIPKARKYLRYCSQAGLAECSNLAGQFEAEPAPAKQ
jgi:TonB family protein